jgi:hypothetical protein
MIIATPISHLFEDKKKAGEIISLSDCLEVRERSLNSSWPKQYLFHIDFDINHEWDDSRRQYLERAFKLKPDLLLISFQATSCCDGFIIEDGMYQLKGRVYSREEMLDCANINITWLRSVIDEKISIALENNNYYPTAAYDIITEGTFISEIVYGNRINLLLDIAHAQVTAHNKNIDYLQYINSLPLKNLIQLHICSPSVYSNGIAFDAHMAPDEKMFEQVLKLISSHKSIKYLTIEYYKSAEILKASLTRLSELLES